MTSDAANGGGYAAGAIGIAAIVLRTCSPAGCPRGQMALAASATWPRSRPSSLSGDADRPPLRHRHPPDARPCARPWRGRRSATTSTARTRPSTRSSAGRGAVRARGGAVRAVGHDGQPDRHPALGRAGRRGLRARQLARADRRGRRHGGALGRAPARAAQRRPRSRRRGAARRGADGRERRPPARGAAALHREHAHGLGRARLERRVAGARDGTGARARPARAHGRRAAAQRGRRARLHAGRGQRRGRQRVVLLLQGARRARRLDPRLLRARRSRAGAGGASCSAAACARPA